MKFNQLQTAKPKVAKRVGRGISAGQGKTAGRGTKGQRSRTGSSKNPGFVGGQNPLMQALPKLPGFKSHRIKAENVFTDQLDALAAKPVTNAALAAAGLTSSEFVNVKLLKRGDAVAKKLTVHLQGASQTAVAVIEAAGGSFEVAPRTARPMTSERRIAAKKEAKEA